MVDIGFWNHRDTALRRFRRMSSQRGFAPLCRLRNVGDRRSAIGGLEKAVGRFRGVIAYWVLETLRFQWHRGIASALRRFFTIPRSNLPTFPLPASRFLPTRAVFKNGIKFLFPAILLCGTLRAAENTGKKIYTQKCLACHKKTEFPLTLENLFFEYLLKYSSERRVKKALIHYLRHPNKKDSVVLEDLIQRYGLMPPTKLDDTDLRRAVDYYWQKYKVFGKIK